MGRDIISLYVGPAKPVLIQHSAYLESVEWRPLANGGKVSAAEPTERKGDFLFQTLAHFSFAATFPLSNGISAAPLRLIVNVVGTAKQTPIKKL